MTTGASKRVQRRESMIVGGVVARLARPSELDGSENERGGAFSGSRFEGLIVGGSQNRERDVKRAKAV